MVGRNTAIAITAMVDTGVLIQLPVTRLTMIGIGAKLTIALNLIKVK